MRKGCFLGFVCGALLWSGAVLAEGADKKAAAWTVEIVQDARVVKPDKSGNLWVERAPFTIRVTMAAPETVQLNVTDNPALQKLINPGWSTQRCDTDTFQDRLLPFCPGTGMAEYPRNQKKRLFLTPYAHHYLHYGGPEEHKWSRVSPTAQKGVLFEREVRCLNADEVAISAWGGKSLYMIFMVDTHKDPVVHSDEIKKLTLSFR